MGYGFKVAVLITDTNALTDATVVEIVRLDANICLKVDLSQTNIRMVNS